MCDCGFCGALIFFFFERFSESISLIMSKKSHNKIRGIGSGIKYLKDIKDEDVLAFLVVHMERCFFSD